MSDKSLGLYKGINKGCLCVNTVHRMTESFQKDN